MSMSPPGYNAEADFAATGSVVCDDCGSRSRTRSLASLPGHDCTTEQHANQRMLSLVVQRRVFRDLAGNAQMWNTDGPQPVAEPAEYAVLARLTAAGMVMLREAGREPYYEITDRALSGA